MSTPRVNERGHRMTVGALARCALTPARIDAERSADNWRVWEREMVDAAHAEARERRLDRLRDAALGCPMEVLDG